LSGAELALKTYKVPAVNKITVPGVFEIPTVIARNIKKFDAFIALGCVIKGQTPHFDYICSAVTNGIMDISITHKKPIGYGILTCLNKKQALERANPKQKNLGKGGEAAEAVIKILRNT
jgi:6,7-dimethyl-8-ribityllumazine synthase